MKRARTRTLRTRSKGQAIMEFAIVASMLLLLVSGIIDFGRIVVARNTLSSISREGANLASRGMPLATALGSVFASSGSLDLRNNGYVILTKVSRDTLGAATITEQLGGGASPTTSVVGTGEGSRANMPMSNFPPNGQNAYVAEVSWRLRPITPLGALLKSALPTRLQDVAYF